MATVPDIAAAVMNDPKRYAYVDTFIPVTPATSAPSGNVIASIIQPSQTTVTATETASSAQATLALLNSDAQPVQQAPIVTTMQDNFKIMPLVIAFGALLLILQR